MNKNENLFGETVLTKTKYKNLSVFADPIVISTFTPEKVIFNPPATIVFWGDGSKTVARCSKDDVFEPETGIAIAYAKKAAGSGINLHKVFNKWIPSFYTRLKNQPIVRDVTVLIEKDEEKPIVTTAHKKIFDPEKTRIEMNCRGLTQKDLAAKADLLNGTISAYLTGRCKPSQHNLLKLADAIGVTPDCLLKEEGA